MQALRSRRQPVMSLNSSDRRTARLTLGRIRGAVISFEDGP